MPLYDAPQKSTLPGLPVIDQPSPGAVDELMLYCLSGPKRLTMVFDDDSTAAVDVDGDYPIDPATLPRPIMKYCWTVAR